MPPAAVADNADIHCKPHDLKPETCSALQLWLAMLTFLYVDFLDTTGTLFSMANFMNNFIPGACALPHLSLRTRFIHPNLHSCYTVHPVRYCG